MSAHEHGNASPLVGQRKGEIYAVLRGELRWRRARRRAARAGGAGAVLCLMVAAAVVVMRGATPAPAGNGGPDGAIARGSEHDGASGTTAPDLVPTPAPSQRGERAPEEPAAVLRFAAVVTEQGIAERLSVSSSGRVAIRRIGDEELLAALDEAGGGERFGLVRAGMRLAVVCQTCLGPSDGPAWMQDLRMNRDRPGVSDDVMNGPAGGRSWEWQGGSL